jgi:hypothetical protein
MEICFDEPILNKFEKPKPEIMLAIEQCKARYCNATDQ